MLEGWSVGGFEGSMVGWLGCWGVGGSEAWMVGGLGGWGVGWL
jgi:hypothetical protein